MRTACQRLQRYSLGAGLLHRRACLRCSQVKVAGQIKCSRYLPRGNAFHHVAPQSQSIASVRDRYHTGPVPFSNLETIDVRSEPKLEDVGVKTIEDSLRSMGKAQRKSRSTWIHLLEQYAPKHLKRFTFGSKQDVEGRQDACREIVTILNWARRADSTGVDILAFMVVNGRREAAMYIMELLMNDLASRHPSRLPSTVPSNITWPSGSLDSITARPLDLQHTTHAPVKITPDVSQQSDDPRYAFTMSETSDNTMDHIWATLGSLVVQSADLAEDAAAKVLNTVLLILGEAHNLDLVPENVYSYRRSSLTATVQRPPILHLVSSRILTSISDVAWRYKQDRLIEKAADLGASYEEIGRDPPGGRFRLRVRPLGPEVWLEFILWCCVEGGFTAAGPRIVKLLREQTQNPWFAVTWSLGGGVGQTTPVVDWDRVKLRHGGTTGLIEGYSREKPFVEMPSRTISTEVVLALVEASIDSVSRGGRGSHYQAVQKNITSMLTFLEPHDLPLSFFNYLAVRLVQTEAFDMINKPQNLASWFERLTYMKSLQSAYPSCPPRIAFELNDLSTHSELFAGILHQVLEGFVQKGDVHHALESFNDLQRLTDDSKLRAIDSFLHIEPSNQSRPDPLQSSFSRQDFVGSHGQMPVYKLAGFLDLTSDTGLIGLGQWMIYNDGPDGPLLPESTYKLPSMARALLRFAAVSGDSNLTQRVLGALRSSKLRPTVRVLRTLANAQISSMDFSGAANTLAVLRNSRGGGVGVANIAHLASIVLKLEKNDMYKFESGRERKMFLRYAENLLHRALSGKYDDLGGDYTVSVHAFYDQQISHLLRVFRFFRQSLLFSFASQFPYRERVGNTASLSPQIFNLMVEAVVETRGAAEALRFYKAFCQPVAQNTEGDVTSVASSNPPKKPSNDGGWDFKHRGEDQQALRQPRNVDIMEEDGTRDLHSRDASLTKSGRTGNRGQQQRSRETSNVTETSSADNESEQDVSGTMFVPFTRSEVDGINHEEEIISNRSLDEDFATSFDSPFFQAADDALLASRSDTDKTDGYGTTPVSTETSPRRESNRSFASAYKNSAGVDFAMDQDGPGNGDTELRKQTSHVATPDVRTVRLILRQAAREKREAPSHGDAVEVQDQILDWAVEELRAMGVMDRIIEMEIQKPLHKSDAELFDSQASNS